MNAIPDILHSDTTATTDAARMHRDADIPWVPSPLRGKSSKPLRFLPGGAGFVELLRMEPGLSMPPHRHTGDTHVFHLRGTRRLASGEIVGPGDYVFEPAGNVDAWEVVGDEPLVAFAVVLGEVEFLDADGGVVGRATTASRREEYERYCAATGRDPLELCG